MAEAPEKKVRQWRIMQPTPKYWRLVRNYCAAIGAAATAILMQEAVELPAQVTTVAGYVMVASVAVGAFAQTAHGKD
jgi:hypothetical protein